LIHLVKKDAEKSRQLQEDYDKLQKKLEKAKSIAEKAQYQDLDL